MKLGNIRDYIVEDNKIEIHYALGNACLEVIQPGIINFFVPLWSDEHRSKAIEGIKCESVEFKTEFIEGVLHLKTDTLYVKVTNDFAIEVWDMQKNQLLSTYLGERKIQQRISKKSIALLQAEGHDTSALLEKNHKVSVAFELDPLDRIYGLGDKTGFLNKRGYEYENWNSDIPQAHTDDFHALYKSIPFMMCKKENVSYGLFFDNTFHSYFNLGKESEAYFTYGADDGNFDMYFLAGPKLRDVIQNYTYLTGTTPLPQLWTLGYHQCRWGYECADDIREVAKKYRELQIPCESVQYDIDYMDHFKVFTWDEKNYEKPGALFTELREDGFKPVVIIDPGTKLEPEYFMYEEGMENDYFVKDKDGKVYVNEVWPGESNYPDFGRKEVRQWWGEHHKFLTDLGVGGVWNDMNEPASFRGELPLDVVFSDEERKTTHAEMHNVYGHLMSKATYEGIKKLTGKRPFVITRACYAGTQKYSSVWTGDNQSLWAHLQMMIPQLCNLGMSGFSLCGTDIGGFGADTTPELLSRWIEAAAFSTFFRNHSAKGTRRQEPWQFDAQTIEIYRKYVSLHYKFLPYIYDLMYQGEQNGLPVMRPLVLHYEDDKNTHEINDEYLVGENLLVAPILQQGSTRRVVYLPEGTWYNYWTGEKYSGKQYLMQEALLDECPIYIKGNTVTPTWEPMQYVGDKLPDTLHLLVTPEGGSCIHFQDNGMDYAYKDGKYNLYKFICTADKTLDKQMLHQEYPEYSQIVIDCIC